MYCYQHQEHHAIGLCKHCAKAVCTDCVKDTGHGIACSDSCVSEVDALHQINLRARQLYSIGKKSRLPTTAILFYAFFGLLFTGFGVYPLVYDRDIDWFLVSMGGGFLVFGMLSYVRNRKLQINC